MRTYLSNHTIEKLGVEVQRATRGAPDELKTVQEINEVYNTFEAARQKILMFHFNGDISLQPFHEMDFAVLPHAIAWMGMRDSQKCDGEGKGDASFHSGSSLLYQFVRAMPSLFEPPKTSRKRKERS